MIRLPDWLDPWSANRRLRVEVDQLRSDVRYLNHALHQSNERYDRIRDTCAELRSALALYRIRDANAELRSALYRNEGTD